MNLVSSFLNQITMYRLMLYFLIFLVLIASILSFLGILPYNELDILLEAIFLVAICWVTNKILADLFKVKNNPESALITALILSLILGPVSPLSNILFLSAAGFFAMLSKYILVLNKKHLFNPAAFGAVATAVILGQGASWWVGSMEMAPFIILGGLLILKKIRRFQMVGVFLAVYIIFQILNFQFSIFNLISSPILFFGLVMLIEPLTSPVQSIHRLRFGVLVILAFYIYGNYLNSYIFYPLELALLTGNLLAFFVNKGFRQSLVLKKRENFSKNVIGFKFEPTKKFEFNPGQYLEWTLSHRNPDSRGIRRFFTIASSPTEDFIMLSSKFYENPSTFKTALQGMKVGDEIVVSDLSGEFILPTDTSKKLVFIAGGIGVTPFRSMIKYLTDTKEKRDIVLLFSNKTALDIVFKDILDKGKEVGVKTVYVNTEKDGYIDEKLIKKEVSNFKERIFYISGPEPMVEAFEKMLSNMGVSKKQIKRDYFPGYTDTHQK